MANPIRVHDHVVTGDSPHTWLVSNIFRGASALGDLAYLESLDSSTIRYEPVVNLDRVGDVAPLFEHTFECE